MNFPKSLFNLIIAYCAYHKHVVRCKSKQLGDQMKDRILFNEHGSIRHGLNLYHHPTYHKLTILEVEFKQIFC